MINFREEETKEIEKGFYLWYNIERYYTSAGSGRAKRGKLRTEPCASPGGFMSAQQTWYNKSAWRGFFEPSANHTWLLSKSEPKANDALSRHGIICISRRNSLLRTFADIPFVLIWQKAA